MENCENYKSIKEALEAGGIYSGLTCGISMEPLIHHQRDTIIVVKPEGRLKKYDVPVYLTKSGKYVMHRIIKVCDDHYVIVGDNRTEREYVTDDMICGVLAGFYKNGKRYVDCQKSKSYKLYSRVWVALLPVRPALQLVNRGVNFIKRRVFKREVV